MGLPSSFRDVCSKEIFLINLWPDQIQLYNNGMATALVVHTARDTVYGQIKKLMLDRPETEFERVIRHLGGLLIKIMVIIVVAVLAVNRVLRHPTIEMLLFAMALAVGLTPELLPSIFTITLARGAKDMAKRGVIVKRLNAIENLGSMDVLCTDKTGTLTEVVVQLDDTLDFKGLPSDRPEKQPYSRGLFSYWMLVP